MNRFWLKKGLDFGLDGPSLASDSTIQGREFLGLRENRQVQMCYSRHDEANRLSGDVTQDNLISMKHAT